MERDDDAIESLLRAVADGTSVDWEHEIRERQGNPRLVSPDSADPLEPLREVARIAEFHRSLMRSGDTSVAAGALRGLDRWGDLLILELIAQGANARVYRAWDAKLHREVALKLIPSSSPGLQHSAPEEAFDNAPLVREGRALARVRHAHIVTVFGIAEHHGQTGLWMEYIAGSTLEQEVGRRGALPAAEVLRLARELGGALDAVHAAGLVHRDVKPANIVRDAAGRFVLTDFGLGVRFDDTAWITGPVSGTPMYMAPELFKGKPASPQTDFYALGLVLRYALSGRLPYDAEDLSSLKAALDRGLNPAAVDFPGVPAELLATIDRWTGIGQRAGLGERTDPGARADVKGGGKAPPFMRRVALATAGFLALAAATIILSNREARERHEERGLAAREVAANGRVTAPERDAPPENAASAAPSGPDGGLASAETSASAVAGSPDAQGDGPASGVAPPAFPPYSVSAAFFLRRDDSASRLQSGDRVSPGDRLSLEVRTSCKTWVYVMNEDEAGACFLLFPQPMFDRTNPLPASESLVLPGPVRGQEHAWTVTTAGGREHFLVVVSPAPVPELESALGTLPAPSPGAAIVYASVPEEAVERLRGVGGVSPLETAAPPPSNGAVHPFARFRALAEKEPTVEGVFVRHVTFENPATPAAR